MELWFEEDVFKRGDIHKRASATASKILSEQFGTIRQGPKMKKKDVYVCFKNLTGPKAIGVLNKWDKKHDPINFTEFMQRGSKLRNCQDNIYSHIRVPEPATATGESLFEDIISLMKINNIRPEKTLTNSQMLSKPNKRTELPEKALKPLKNEVRYLNSKNGEQKRKWFKRFGF